MTTDRFSRREGLERAEGNPTWDDAPPGLRVGLVFVLRDYIEVPHWAADRAIARATGTSTLNRDDSQWRELLGRLLTCEWPEFYDSCEFIHEELLRVSNYRTYAPLYEARLNDLLGRQNIGWRMSEGKLQRSISPAVDEHVKKAKILLGFGEERFEGPSDQLSKAIAFISERPQPDRENCVKDAVGAMEATARVLTGDEKALLPDILEREPFRSEIHGALKEVMKRVYGYRGDVGGVAHGKVGPSKVGIEEAELALGVCASAIVYLINKFGKPTS